MFETKTMKSQKEKDAKKKTVSVAVDNTIKCSGYNAFQTGHGAHGGSKKARNKKSRKEGKAICRSEY